MLLSLLYWFMFSVWVQLKRVGIHRALRTERITQILRSPEGPLVSLGEVTTAVVTRFD